MTTNKIGIKVIGLTLLVLVLWSGSLLGVYHWIPDWPNRGSFGDMFGAVGALFSGLAFVGLIVTIGVQIEQLKLQGDQLRETKDELTRQKEMIEAQNESIFKQRFEDTFFQLLKLHNDIVSTMDIENNQGTIRRGRDCFVVMYNELFRDFSHAAGSQDEISKVNHIFLHFYQNHQADLGHYFSHLRGIVEFVHSNEISHKQFYIDLLTSQLSTHEQLLLFYYCLDEDRSKSLKALVQRYRILEGVPEDKLLSIQHSKFYEPSAARIQ